MRWLLAAIATAGMVLTVTACGGSGNGGSGSNNTTQGSGY